MSDTNWMEQCLEAVRQEALEAEAKYGPFASTHEGYGVLAEEVAELLEAIRSEVAGRIEVEAVQVAAVALRLAAACRKARDADVQGTFASDPFAARSFKWAR